MKHKPKLRCVLFPLIILELVRHIKWSPPVVNPDWNDLETHTPVYVWSQGMSEHNRSMKSKELSVGFSDRIVSRRRQYSAVVT